MNLVTLQGPALISTLGGNADSGPAYMTPDGRYFLFSSAANNLALNPNGNPFPVLLPPHTCVYLRDCSNNTTTLISVNLAGTGSGNGDCFADGISSNGLFALFESNAGDLIGGHTNGAVNIYLRDIINGTNILVSASTNGLFGNGNSSRATMTPDAQCVAFMSSASNLVSGDTNAIPDIFVRNIQSNITVMASPAAMWTGSNAGSYSAAPQITPDGRYVVFYSSATNLVTGITNVGDIYVRDLILQTTYWASTGARTQLQAAFGITNGVCFSPRISADGSEIAYEVSATGFGKTAGVILRYNLFSGITDVVNTNANAPVGIYEDMRTLDLSANGRFVASVVNTDSLGLNTAVYLWDALSGTNLLVSATVSNTPSSGSSYDPVIDVSGRYVAFLSQSTNLTSNQLAGDCHIYFRDTQLASTVLVDVNTNGIGMGVNPAGFPSLSGNAQLLAFESANFGDHNYFMDVFAAQLQSNVVELISISNPGIASQSPNGPSVFSSSAPISSNGQYIVFASDANNLVAGDANGFRDVFMRDQNGNANILISADTNGLPAAGISSEASTSADGRYVVFSSSAASLVFGDTNNVSDVFERDRQAGVTKLISLNTNGTGPGNAGSYSPVIGGDGRFVLFRSQAQNLAQGSFGAGVENLFLRDLQLATNYALTAATSGAVIFPVAMTPDGHYVAFIGNRAGSSTANLYVWNSLLAKVVYTNTTASFTQVSISPDGQRVACSTATTMMIVDLANPTNSSTIGSGSSGSFSTDWGWHFSANGNWLVYESSSTNLAPAYTNSFKQIYLYDVLAHTNFLVSQSLGGNGAGDGASDSPAISPDGRFIAYRSYADNLVSGDSNNVPDLFVYDRTNGSTTLLTASQFGSRSGDNRSLLPVFSADGQTLLFQSSASDLVANDGNRFSELFSVSLYAAGMIPTFYLQIIPSGSPVKNPTLIWPVIYGRNYQVQYKNSLTDASWQTLPGNATILGSTAYFTDLTPVNPQRFYKVVGF